MKKKTVSSARKRKAPARAKARKLPPRDLHAPTQPVAPVIAEPVQRETVLHHVGRMLRAIFGEPLPDETVKVVAEKVIEVLPKRR